MRVEVKKFLFVGLKKDIELFFEAAQRAGLVEFIAEKRERPSQDPILHEIAAAIKVLRAQPVREPFDLDSLDEAQALAKEINEKQLLWQELFNRVEKACRIFWLLLMGRDKRIRGEEFALFPLLF
jgi:hypothetical protein